MHLSPHLATPLPLLPGSLVTCLCKHCRMVLAWNAAAIDINEGVPLQQDPCVGTCRAHSHTLGLAMARILPSAHLTWANAVCEWAQAGRCGQQLAVAVAAEQDLRAAAVAARWRHHQQRGLHVGGQQPQLVGSHQRVQEHLITDLHKFVGRGQQGSAQAQQGPCWWQGFKGSVLLAQTGLQPA